MSFTSLFTSASGLSAQRLRLDVIANNLANVDTTHRSDGQSGPYRRQHVTLEPRNNPIRFNLPFVEGSDPVTQAPGKGVIVGAVSESRGPIPEKYLRYEPGHPDARPDGYVEMPDVDIAVEMVDMIDASRAYEANVTAIRDFRSMYSEALKILA